MTEHTPIPDDERPVEDEPVVSADEPLPDPERPVTDRGVDVGPGVALPDDERPVPEDEELDIG